MAFSPQYVGATYNPLAISWTRDGAAPQSLVGLIVEFWFQSTRTPAKYFKGTGTLVVSDAVNGKITYTFSQADLGVEDEYIVQFKAYPAAQPLNALYSDKDDLRVLPSVVGSAPTPNPTPPPPSGHVATLIVDGAASFTAGPVTIGGDSGLTVTTTNWGQLQLNASNVGGNVAFGMSVDTSGTPVSPFQIFGSAAGGVLIYSFGSGTIFMRDNKVNINLGGKPPVGAAALQVVGYPGSDPVLDVRGGSGQTAALQRWVATDGVTVYASIASDGKALFTNDVRISGSNTLRLGSGNTVVADSAGRLQLVGGAGYIDGGWGATLGLFDGVGNALFGAGTNATGPGVAWSYVSADGAVKDLLRLISTNATNPRTIAMGPNIGGAALAFAIRDITASRQLAAWDTTGALQLVTSVSVTASSQPQLNLNSQTGHNLKLYSDDANNRFVAYDVTATGSLWTASTAAFLVPSGLGVWGHAAPGSQPAAPVTLADVIGIIRGAGLSA
jgi:hypothetical protein